MTKHSIVAGDSRKVRILVLNPNSSASITDGMREILERRTIPPSSIVTCATAPSTSPLSINDPLTSIASTSACLQGFEAAGEGSVFDVDAYDAILVGCFSEHPLVGCLRFKYPTKPSMHILQSALTFALSSSSDRFGIITTGEDMVSDIEKGVQAFLGASSDRYVGAIATGLPVLHLNNASRRNEVEAAMSKASETLSRQGANVFILGCAGMSGMENFVRSGIVKHKGEQIANLALIIDGLVVGVHLLAGIARNYLA